MTATIQATRPGMTAATREITGPAGAPLVGNTLQLQRDPLGFIMRVATEYGDVARYRLGNVTFNQVSHPDGAQRILQENHHNYIKGDMFDILRQLAGDGLFTSEGDLWL
ncbi:MAG: cytochrome P450, partial [Anaerolineae bacterium]|nr:cytochrome P450 [Anaerolineae bacterium]